MLTKIAFAAPVWVFLLTACSSPDSSTSTAGDTRGTGGGGTTSPASGGSASVGGTSSITGGTGNDPNSTSACAPWPQSKLMPLIGIRFYGPSPGPCTITTPSYTLTFTYDSNGAPIRAASADNSTVWTYTYQNGQMAYEVDVQNGSTGTIDFTYGTHSLAYSYSSSNASTGYTATYTLDDRGYPQVIAMSGPATSSPTFPTRYVYTYEACRITSRIAYNQDGTIASSSNLLYEYDSVGHLVRIYSNGGPTDMKFDYSCW